MAKMNCGLVYSTKLQISDVEAWLDANCRGDCQLSLADVNTGSGQLAKKLEIYFELPADRDQFRQLFVGFEKDRLANPGAAVTAAAAPPAKSGWFGMLRQDKA